MATIIHLKRNNDAPFHLQASNELGNVLDMDSNNMSESKGMSPMQVLLAALAGCTSIDVLMILAKMKQEVLDYDVEISGEKEPVGDANPYKTIHIKYLLKGDLDAQKVERAIQLSMEKYCSVSKMLEATASITTSFEIL